MIMEDKPLRRCQYAQFLHLQSPERAGQDNLAAGVYPVLRLFFGQTWSANSNICPLRTTPYSNSKEFQR
jgi:hypothetical protein